MTQRFSLATVVVVVVEKEGIVNLGEQCNVEDGSFAKDTKALEKRIYTVLSQRIGNAKD